MRTSCVAMLTVLLLSVCVSAEEKASKDKSIDLKRILGQWNYVSGKKAGADVDKKVLVGTVSITKETFTLPAGPNSVFVMTYSIDASKNPVPIDLKIKSGPVPEGSAVGIIRLKGRQLELCYDPAGKKRPKDFKSTEENGAFLFVMKKNEQ